MSTIPESARRLVETGRLAHVVTLNPDGSAHVSLAWAGFDGDELICATFFADQHKIMNLRRDPRITASFEAAENPGPGLHPYLVVSGVARVTEGGALDVMDKLAEWYIGPGAKYPRRDFPPGQVVHVTVQRIYGQGPWREEAKARSSGDDSTED